MKPTLPPSTIGIIGGGQLGMMTVREAQRMGYRTAIWDPEAECPASRLADVSITASFDDRRAAEQMATVADVITYEFENVEPEIVRWLEQENRVFPGSEILRISRNRTIEKEELRKRGFPVVDFTVAHSEASLRNAVDTLKLPVVVKTASLGYDGKGQAVLYSENDVKEFLNGFGERESVVEKHVDLLCELSVIVARSYDGSTATFPIAENIHRENILHVSYVPARVDKELQKEATALAISIADAFEIIGLLCVEMFITRQSKVLVNELAPRPHNSGHYSLDACNVSQFEAFVRMICGLALDRPRLLTPCAMVNILGHHVNQLDVEALHKLPGIKLHLYGKREARPKRKMGHVTILNESPKELARLVAVVEEMILQDNEVTSYEFIR